MAKPKGHKKSCKCVVCGAGTSVAMAYRHATQKIKTATATQVKLDTVINDPGSHVNLTTGAYVVPATGYYHVDGEVTIPNAKGYCAAYIYKNGREVIHGNEVGGGLTTGVLSLNANGIVYAAAGETLELWVYQESGSEQPVEGGATTNRLCVMRVGEGPAGPENKLVEESIGMAYRNSAQNLAAATNTKIKLNSVIKDPGSNIGANEFYTVPATGYYHVDGEVLAVPAANAYLVANIWVNGVAALAGSMTSEGGEAYNGSSVSGIIYCAKGDKIELVGYNSGVEKALIIEAGKNRLSVNRVGAGPQGPQGPQGATGATGGPGKSWKVPVAYATTKALTIHSETSTTLTGEEEPLTIDGSIPALHGRVLVKNQSESKQDGIYEVTTLGSSGKTRWVLTRTGDANTSEELAEACVMVEAGTQNQGKRYSQRFGVTVVGTTAQEWLPSSVGPWTALESYTSKTESRTTQVRWENDGASARIHGTVLCNAALPASTKIFQLPEGFRPAETVFINIQQLAGSVVQLIIQTTGVVENRAETNSYLSFDGVTFQLV